MSKTYYPALFPTATLRIGPDEDFEPVNYYQKGGYYPATPGDIVADRYKVVNKLGFGPHSTTWLCKDLENTSDLVSAHVALKILRANIDRDNHLEARLKQKVSLNGTKMRLPLATIVTESPFGAHIVLVYQFLGPKIGQEDGHAQPLRPTGHSKHDLRQICLQLVESVVTLHAANICHGNLQATKVLPPFTNAEAALPALLKKVHGTTVRSTDDKGDIDPSVPENLTLPVPWNLVPESERLSTSTDEALLIGFGSAYDASNPQSYGGPPRLNIASPEWLLEGKSGKPSDIWALGCTIFHIRTGQQFMITPWKDTDGTDEFLDDLTDYLGKLPEPWWSETWKKRKDLVEDEREFDPDELKNKVAECLNKRDGKDQADEKEIEVFTSLLKKILRWKPEDRPSAEEILQHDWFTMKD